MDRDAVGYGLVAFAVCLLVLFATASDPLVLTIGLPCGVVAGLRAGRPLAGATAGFVVGCLIAGVYVVSAYLLLTSGPATQGGVGAVMKLVLVALLGAGQVLESTVAGAVAGGAVAVHGRLRRPTG